MSNEQNNQSIKTPVIHFWERVIVILLGCGFATGILSVAWGPYGELRSIKVAVFLLGMLALILCAGLWNIGIRGLFKRRSLFFFGWYIVGVVSLVVLLYVFEGWRGKRAWNSLVKEVAAGGETLDCASIFPKSVPENKNLLYAPEAAKYFFSNEPHSRETFYDFHHEFHSHSNWVYGTYTDFKRWDESLKRMRNPLFPQNTERSNISLPSQTGTDVNDIQYAKNVLGHLKYFDPIFSSLKAATDRTEAQLPLNPGEGWFAQTNTHHRLALRTLVQVLNLHASAQLALNQSDEAFNDMMLSFRLADALSREPFFFSWKMKSQLHFYILQPLWEGINRHAWTESQLASFQKYLKNPDIYIDLKTALRNESILYIDLANRLQALDTSIDDIKWVLYFYPKGWLYLDRVWLYRFYQRYAHASKMDPLGKTIRVHNEFKEIDDPFVVTFVLPKMLATYEEILFSVTWNKILFHLANTACALEQYRHKNGNFPQTLQELLPAYLTSIPSDLISKQSLVYKRVKDGSYLLYSVGWNQIDEGGNPPVFINNKNYHGLEAFSADIEKGDWPWAGKTPSKP